MGVVKEAVDDTAGAAKAIAQQQLRCVVRQACPPLGLHALSAGALVRDCAAVASSRAGELYGMQIMDQGIQDDQDNFTYNPAMCCARLLRDSLLRRRRFIALSREPVPPSNPLLTYKTSIVFSLAEGAHVQLNQPQSRAERRRHCTAPRRAWHAVQGAVLLCAA